MSKELKNQIKTEIQEYEREYDQVQFQFDSDHEKVEKGKNIEKSENVHKTEKAEENHQINEITENKEELIYLKGNEEQKQEEREISKISDKKTEEMDEEIDEEMDDQVATITVVDHDLKYGNIIKAKFERRSGSRSLSRRFSVLDKTKDIVEDLENTKSMSSSINQIATSDK